MLILNVPKPQIQTPEPQYWTCAIFTCAIFTCEIFNWTIFSWHQFSPFS